MKKTKIYVATHKGFVPPKDDIYVPIQLGKQFTGTELPFLNDGEGENIAEKNKSYCELTALYWIWKNDKESDIVGLCHYRRYLTTKIISIDMNNALTEKQIKKILKKYDAIVPDKTWYNKPTTMRDKWIRCNNFEKDLEKTRDIIERLYPEYLKDYDELLQKSSAHLYNIIIAKKELIDSYCEWLFSICDELEKVMDFSEYNTTQARFYGLISENLLDVWCNHNGIKRYYCRMLETELDHKRQYKNAVKRIRDKVLRNGQG